MQRRNIIGTILILRPIVEITTGGVIVYGFFIKWRDFVNDDDDDDIRSAPHRKSIWVWPIILIWQPTCVGKGITLSIITRYPSCKMREAIGQNLSENTRTFCIKPFKRHFAWHHHRAKIEPFEEWYVFTSQKNKRHQWILSYKHLIYWPLNIREDKIKKNSLDVT